MRTRWARHTGIHEGPAGRIPALLGVTVFVQWALVLFWGSALLPWWKSYEPVIGTGLLLAALLVAYAVWMVPLSRGRITGAGACGFAVAALGADLRVWGDFLEVLPEPRALSRELDVLVVTGERAFDPAHLPWIVALSRHGGLAAYVVGLMLVLGCTIADLRARRRLR